MRDFKKFDVWQLSMEVNNIIYTLTSNFPKEEKYNLVSQMRRSAVSISSNIAEGCSRPTDKAFKRFIEFALGSAYELETQIIIAQNVGILCEEKTDVILKKINHVEASLNALRTRLAISD